MNLWKMDGEVEGDGGGEGAGEVHNDKECNLHQAWIL